MTSSPGYDDRYAEPDQLRDQLRRLLRYRVTIATGIVLGLLGGLLLVLLTAGSYSSTSEVLVRSRTDPFSTFGVAADNQVSMGTERQIALSATVAARAARTLGRPSKAAPLLANLRVTNPPDTQVLRFAYTAGTAKGAARVTNAFAEAYLADRQDRTKAMVKRMTSGLEQQIDVLAKRIEAKSDDDPATSAAGLRDQISVLQKRVSDIRSYDTTGGDIVRRAEPPARPSGPGPAWLIGLGLIGGLLLGVVLAWLRSALEPRARSVGEVQAALGARVLGIVPGADADDADPLVVGRAGGSRAEAYRTLAFLLRKTEGRTAAGTLLVVAPKEDGNAEAAAVNLAAAFAESGDDVLLVDATAGAPGLPARLPLLADACAPVGAPEGSAVVDAGTAGRFALLPDSRGTTGDNRPAASAVTRALPYAESGRPVLVITRPLLEHADALAVAQRVDGVLVVGGLNRSRRDDLKRVRELIDCSGGHIVGAVLDSGARRRLLRRAVDGGWGRRIGQRDPDTTPSTPADDLVGEVPAPVQDDTLSVSR
ncbi:hypothetical protein SSP24_25450 [Streptomyces spinoverrucosus]|uniref:Lipopolysaccharide biosynthesis protein n=1 Tax=Streptomyces spinoverrucosus TaxID=284043 RepID=A0A4Y3VGI0_9ACTN|nr:hypothetical protein [Streptomyces spinoverrucosus]GEC04890.1 hypothetical protein SSP24_25450 [Streptomyces spinoverrucosus]GHB60437.1 hypothetical protein GCM10010397_33290 [Streptomyces spinoverrucosus]